MYLSEIAESLSSIKELTAWEITGVKRSEAQLYSIFEEVENRRQVFTEHYHVRIYVNYERDGTALMGESSLVLSGDESAIPKIGPALEMARLVANQPFSLPEMSQGIPKVEASDIKIASDASYYLEKIFDGYRAFDSDCIQKSSSEIFIRENAYNFLNSNRLSAVRNETEIMLDFVLLAGRNHQESEIDCIKRCRLYRDLDLEGILERYSAYARALLSAQLPPTGVFDVLFSDEALDTFFNYFVAQAGGQAAYQGWSRFKPGEPVIASPKGDTLTLESDPYLPGAIKSRPFDENGLVPSRVTVIDNNLFKKHTANKRYADYLGIEATGDFSNLVVPPGTRTMDELLSDGPLLHLLKFSTFEPNSVTGAFSGEIRLGYLIDGEKRIPIKGGAVAGVMAEAMKEVYFSKETTKREAYYGPSAIRVQKLSISGR
ncbi:MAG: metallopeptidase TldD-related protein [Pseudomonadota bacterium]